MKINWDEFREQLLEEIGTKLDEESLPFAVATVAANVTTTALKRYHELLLTSDSEIDSSS